jgi:hypothetical protein
MKTLISYLNDEQLKTDLLIEVKRHEELDMIVQGHYGRENGKFTGCAVGCSIHSLNKIRGKKHNYDDHAVYETEFGIPRIIARLQDKIFEGLPSEEAKKFPFRFLSAIGVGKNLEPVWKLFLVWLLVDPVEGVIKHAKTDQTRKAIQDVADLLSKSLLEKVTSEQFHEVRRAAYAAAAAAADAAYAAAAAAAAADAAYAAYAAAAAAAAADAADAANAAADAAYAARKRKFVVMADKLIELLQAA